MDEKKADWEISDLYSQSWQIIKKCKLLWILGVAAASGGYNFSNFSNFRSADFNKIFNNPNNQELPQKATQVLGAATSTPFMESIKGIFSTIPVYFYFILGAEVLILILIGLVISIIYSAWAQGMLIQATDTAADDKDPTIADSSPKVIPHLGSLVWLKVIPSLILILALVIGLAVVIFGLALGNIVIKVIFGILGIVALGAFIYWMIMLSLTQIWAPRQVVLDGKFGQAALLSSFKLVKKKFWSMILIGLVNILLTGTIMVAIILAIGVVGVILVLIGFLLGKAVPTLIPSLVIIALVITIPILIGLILLGGIAESFKATVWTLAYRKIRGKYD